MTNWDAFIGFLSGVRLTVLLTLVIVWNVLSIAAMRLNGGAGQFRSVSATAVASGASLLFAMFFAALVWIPSVRELAIKPGANLTAVRLTATKLAAVLTLLACALALWAVKLRTAA